MYSVCKRKHGGIKIESSHLLKESRLVVGHKQITIEGKGQTYDGHGQPKFRVTRFGYFIAKFWLFLGSNGLIFWLFFKNILIIFAILKHLGGYFCLFGYFRQFLAIFEKSHPVALLIISDLLYVQ